ATLEVGRHADAIGPHVDRGVAKGARQKDGDADIWVAALGRLDGEARQRHLANVELGMAERAEKDLLGHEGHESRLDPIDLDRAVDQGAYAIVIPERDREFELSHCVRSFVIPGCSRRVNVPVQGLYQRAPPPIKLSLHAPYAARAVSHSNSR